MTPEEFRLVLLKHFSHETTGGQAELIQKLVHFVTSADSGKIFVLKGYAGTGKTTLVGALIKSLPGVKWKSVLLAPTGKAAKVLAKYSGRAAYTIHKKIYRRVSGPDGSSKFIVQPNLEFDSIFIVDEASMISSGGSLSGGFSSGKSLLDDLLEYVSTGVNCKLIFVGDTAQLPPVGLTISPALDEKFLKSNYHFSIDSIELKEVVRQSKSSGILANATHLRDMISPDSKEVPKFNLEDFTDIVRIGGMELEDALNDSYSKHGAEETIVICRSNKRANIYNQQIRARIRWQENEISSGDYMMIVKNNYFWLPEESRAGFIANGDTVEIMKVSNHEEIDGFKFADARLRLVDYPDEPVLETKLLLNTIMSESPALPAAESKRLYETISASYGDVANKYNRLLKVKKDPYFNALQVKFAYAVTCHKAQGGQWESVFVEQGYVTDEMINSEFLRWLYTALTRATQKLYLVNFNKSFFD